MLPWKSFGLVGIHGLDVAPESPFSAWHDIFMLRNSLAIGMMNFTENPLAVAGNFLSLSSTGSAPHLSLNQLLLLVSQEVGLSGDPNYLQ
jgi:hypothetical protein